MLENLKDKKILILGLGREGVSTYKFLHSLFPNKTFGLADQQSWDQLSLKSLLAPPTPKVHLHLGSDYLESLKDYDIIIKTPGIPPFPEILKAQNMGKITSQIKLFFENCSGTIIGVTGTKGKSTATSLIYEVLSAPGAEFSRRSWSGIYLAGNIGQPVLPLLKKADKDSIFVFELSSHQLMDLTQSPHIAVLLNLYPEHLDYYKNFEEYAQAKANITRYQTKNDWFIYNAHSPEIVRIAEKTKAQRTSFSISSPKTDVSIKNDWIYYQKEKITPISLIPLLGKFNLANVMPAIAIGKIFEIPNKTIVQTIKTFQPLPHRLELVGSFKGITFYNDALATIPEATIAAIRTLNEKGFKVSTILLGGFDRKLDFTKLAQEIIKQKIKTIILFPTTGQKIWQAIKKTLPTVPKHFFVDNMKEAVKLAYQHTPKGKICLLSTASSSFSIFKDYRQKGELFKKYVKRLARS